MAQHPDAETLAYLAASIALGIGAAWAGLRLGGRPRAGMEVDE